MTDAQTIETPGMGDNQPPTEIEELRLRLTEESGRLITRRDELLGSVERAPATITDEDTSGKVSDLVKMIMACHKTAEGARVAAKEPFLEGGRAVDGFFKTITDPLEKGRAVLDRRLTEYHRVKANEERRIREEEARLRAAAAEQARKEAEDAARAAETEADLNTAIVAEAEAAQAAADATVAQRAAAAKPAELSRTRGDLGSVASLHTFMDFRGLDRATLDLEALREHLPLNALEQAVRSFIKAGGRKLAGVEIFENATTRVR